MAEDSGYESVICVKPEVHVYRIPPRASNRGYRAADWKLDEPAWTGRMKIISKGKVAFIKLEDKNSGELFAQAQMDQYPGCVVEAVTDSSRYFVMQIQDDNGRHAFIGLGFADRGDSFDFNVALQDHFKWVKQESELAKQEANQSVAPPLDLGFKDGQTIKISIGNVKTKAGGAKSRAMPGGLLPPPPGGAKIGSPQSPPLTPPNTVMRELPLWSSSVVLFLVSRREAMAPAAPAPGLCLTWDVVVFLSPDPSLPVGPRPRGPRGPAHAGHLGRLHIGAGRLQPQ
uniref:NECAP endocytosis associated 2 n=1 Tax=Gadus morhua TaxID=8049 RepID=A0A8C5BQR8_GADMO